ncbi:MAG: SsrA-binding protein SmpB [Candidatus Cloacimonetes bacterium]|jgi:SsrA-binding protein|nr:SsrA-binding protein SmpB [Candidatus Cloacimonadota bacterium]MBT6993429.1 SsrA-binding protein SmpB [Candidatus Cloacimonadota bacterium]MBT7470039.1 SsrA-binding protein SmpB [Candidatus Cloacimonadota bacterium]
MTKFQNKKARFNFFFISEIETGIVLKGTEIKSIRAGKLSFKDSYARIENDEIWLYNLHISIYEEGSIFNHVPERKRKLLLHKREIKKMKKQVEEKGLTLVPKTLFINKNNLVKVILTVAKGKKRFDKRDDIKQKDVARELQRTEKMR